MSVLIHAHTILEVSAVVHIPRSVLEVHECSISACFIIESAKIRGHLLAGMCTYLGMAHTLTLFHYLLKYERNIKQKSQTGKI